MNAPALSAALAALTLAACAVGPNYRAAALPVVAAHNVNDAQFSSAAPQSAWWQQFDDPELASLESRAAAQDLTLQLALTRVQAARAVFHGTRLDYAPHIPLQASVSRAKEQQPGFTDQRIDIDSYSVGFDASCSDARDARCRPHAPIWARSRRALPMHA